MGGHLHRAYIGNSLDVYPGADREHGVIIVECGTSTSRRGRAREREKNSFNLIRIEDEVIRITHHMFFERSATMPEGFAPISRHVFPRSGRQRLPGTWLEREAPDIAAAADVMADEQRTGTASGASSADRQGMGEQARPHAERRVRARLLLDAIAAQEAIEVGEPEFEQALAVLARLQGVATQVLRQKLDESGELAGLRARMRREKTVTFLLGEDTSAPAPDGAGG